MAEKKPDRRALKTQRQLKDALAALLAEKEIRHITVQELSDTADVHRVTFYKHYYDIYDLYEQLENEVMSELGLLLLAFEENASEDFSAKLIDYIADNPNVFKMIFSPHNKSELRHKFSTMVAGIFRVIQAEKSTVEVKDETLDYYCSYFSSGCVAIIEKWVLDDFKKSKEFIVDTLCVLDKHMAQFMDEQLG